VLYVTLSETREEIEAVAVSHGWSLEGLSIRELVPTEGSLEPGEQYTVFHPSEVELSDTTRKILDDVEKVKPTRIVFDSMSSCGCSRATRCATGARSSRSSSTSRAAAARCCCSTT
jgi:KaiC/GvpD/RAD55 family RecA-like ATPase